MNVILRDDVYPLGEAGEIVTVKDGYARNYLIPRNLAYVATKSNLRVWEDEKQVRLMRIGRETTAAERVKGALESVSVTIDMQAGEEGRLFGQVTNRLVASELEAQHGIELDSRHVVIDEPIRAQGEFVVQVRLAHGVVADLKLLVRGQLEDGTFVEAPEEPADEEAPAPEGGPTDGTQEEAVAAASAEPETDTEEEA